MERGSVVGRPGTRVSKVSGTSDRPASLSPFEFIGIAMRSGGRSGQARMAGSRCVRARRPGVRGLQE